MATLTLTLLEQLELCRGFLFTGVIRMECRDWRRCGVSFNTSDPYDSLPIKTLHQVPRRVYMRERSGTNRGFIANERLRDRGSGWLYVGCRSYRRFDVIASELWRKPLASRRISVGLMPNPRGRLSAVATLRF